MSHEYLLEIPDLAAAVAAAPADPRDTRHKSLIQALCAFPVLASVELATSRGDSYYTQRRVFTASGEWVHDDHRAWLVQEFVNDGARAGVTYQRLRAADLRLSRTEITTLFLVVDRGGDEANFLQVEVELLTERMANHLLSDWGMAPGDARELVDEASGQELPAQEQIVLGAPRYQLRRVIDMARFLDIIDADEEKQRSRARALRFNVTDSSSKAPMGQVRYTDMDPGFDKYPAKGRRLFRDWAASSAGRSGQRLCRHWVMQISDSQDPQSRARWVSLVPMWTYGKPLAKVDAHKGSVHALYDKLQSMDRRTGVPFAWFFYMLHGNRVREGAAYCVLDAAEAGQIDLPEQDYQVLRRWKDREYGF